MMINGNAAFEEAMAERAGIMEHDGGLPRDKAEALALEDAKRAWHAGEVDRIVRIYREGGKSAVGELLDAHEETWGKEVRDRLRADALREIGK